MAAPAIGARPTFAAGQASIDASHPLAAGLLGVVAPDFQAGVITRRGNVAPVVSSPWGLAWNGGATNATQLRLGTSVPMASGVTFAAVAVMTSGSSMQMFSSDSGSVPGRAWQFRASVASGAQIIVFNSASTTVIANVTTPAATVAAGVPFAAIATVSSDRVANCWARNATGAAGAATPAGGGSTGDWSVSTADVGGGVGPVGSVTAAFYWGRALTSDQALAWLADPFCVLRR